MKVGCVITNHNYADMVARAIGSVLGQSHRDIEIIVVDDASYDNSRDAIQGTGVDCAWLDDRLGPAGAKNMGASLLLENHPDVELLAFLDADDMYQPEYIEKAVEVFAGEPGRIGIVYCDHLVADVCDGTRYVDFKPPYSYAAMQQRDVVGGNFITSRKAWDFSRGFYAGLPVCENHDFVKRVAAKFVPIHIPEVLVSTTILPRSLRSVVPLAVWAKCLKG